MKTDCIITTNGDKEKDTENKIFNFHLTIGLKMF